MAGLEPDRVLTFPILSDGSVGGQLKVGVVSVDWCPRWIATRFIERGSVHADEVPLTVRHGEDIAVGYPGSGADGHMEGSMVVGWELSPGASLHLTAVGADGEGAMSVDYELPQAPPPAAIVQDVAAADIDDPRWTDEELRRALFETDRERRREAVRRATEVYLRADRVLPEQLTPLGADLGEIVGGRLTLLALEHWTDAFVLRHHWDYPTDLAAPIYSPLSGFLILRDDRGNEYTGSSGPLSHDEFGTFGSQIFTPALDPDATRISIEVPSIDGPLVTSQVLLPERG